MAVKRIDSVFDRQAIKTELGEVKSLLKTYSSELKELSKQRVKIEGAQGVKEMNAELTALTTKINELKLRNQELSNQQKQFNLEVAKDREARRLAAQERKEQIAQEKQASLDAVNQQRIKNVSLQEEKNLKDQLAETDRKLAEAESQRLGVPTTNQRAQLTSPAQPRESFVPANDLEFAILQQTKQQAALDKTTLAKKALTAEYNAGNLTQAEYERELVKTIALENELKLSVAALGKEVQAQSKIAFSAPSSIDEARARVASLSQQRNAIPTGELATAEDIANIKSLNDQIDVQNKLIDDNSDRLAKQKINIGNYPKAFTDASNVIKAELEAVNTKVASGAFSGKAYEDLILKQQTLSKTVSITGGTFTTQTAALKTYQQAAVDIGTVYGTNSEVFKNFTANVAQGGAQVVAMDKSVKSATTSGKGLGGLFSSLGAGAVKLARLLPGIGIVGLIAFATDPIIKWITAVKVATGDAKILEDTFREGAKAAADQVAALNIQRELLNDLSKTSQERIKIAEQYNKTAAEGNKINLEEINNLTAINAQIEKQIDLIERQSLAKAAQAQISKFADVAIQAEFDLQKALNQTGISEEKVSKSLENRIKKQDDLSVKQQRTLDGFNKPIIAIDKKFQDPIAQVELVDKKLEALLVRKRSAAAELQRVIALLRPQLDVPTTTTSGNTKQIADLIKWQSTEFDIYKKYQQEKIDLLKGGLDNDRIYYLDKIKILDQYIAARQELLDREKANEVAAAQDETKRQIDNLQKDKSGKNASQIARINENIAILQKNLNQQLLAIDADYQVKSRALGREKPVELKKINDAQLKVEQEFADDRLALEKQTLDGLAALNKKRLGINNQILEIEKKLQKDLAEVKRSSVENSAKEIEGLIFDAMQKQQDIRIQGYDKEIELIDARTQRQIDGINKSNLAEEERNRLITQLENKAQAEKDALERKKEAAEKRKKSSEQKAALAAIAFNLASSLFEVQRRATEAYASTFATTQGNVAVKTAQANAARALVLSQIGGLIANATTSAAKLAFFREGKSKDNKYQGPAMVAEAVPEWIHRKSGSVERVTKPSLTYLMADDVVYKDDKAFIRAIMNSANPFRQIQVHKEQSSDYNRDVLVNIERQLILANRKQQPSWIIGDKVEATPFWENHIKN